MMRHTILITLCLFTTALFGQDPVKIGDVTVSGSLRSRTEIWDFFQGGANNGYAFSGNIFKLSFARSTKRLDWQVELAAPFLLNLPDDAIAAAPQLQLGLGGNYYSANKSHRFAGMVFPKQGYLRFKGLFGDKDQSLRVGRFEWMDGGEVTPKDATLAALKRDRVTQRLIGSFGWSNVGRSFDGFEYKASKGNITYSLVSALATRGAFQVDGWGNLKTGFSYGSATGQVGKGRNVGEWRALAVYYQDWRHVLKTDNRAVAARQLDMDNIRIGTYGGHYIHKTETSAGIFDFMLWGMLQSGQWGRQDHRSNAFDLEAGWQPKAMPRLKPWLMGGVTRTGGDNNPLDNRHGSYFQMLPTPRPYARIPFYNMMNNRDLYGILALRPHKAVTLRSEFHSLSLANRNDLWYVGGGAFQPWTFGFIGRNAGGAQSLANQWDTSIDWTVNKNWSITGYYAFVDGKAAMRAIFPKDQTAQFAYIELNYKF